MLRINTKQQSRKLVFLAFSLRPSRLRGESAVPRSPPRREERKESAKKNSFQPGHVRFGRLIPVYCCPVREPAAGAESNPGRPDCRAAL